MADVKFTAIRGVFTKAGKIRPGEKGAAPKEAVEIWLASGAVKLEIPDDKPAPRRRRTKAPEATHD